MKESKLKKTLEEEGFEDIGGFSFVCPEKEDSTKYLTLNLLLGSAIAQGYTDIAIDLSKVKETPNYLFTIYGKK
jgi:hypothetical protein